MVGSLPASLNGGERSLSPLARKAQSAVRRHMSIRSTFKAKEDVPPISHDGLKVKIQGKRRKDFFSTFIPSMLQLSAPALIFMSFVIYIGCTLFFAFLFYGQGADCFVLPARPTEFHYEAFWLSVQTFSTVGFGSIYPICFSGHLVVVFECFSSLIVNAILGGAIFFNVMLPRSRIRFSKQALVDVDVHPRTGTSYKMITFRLVRESNATMRDANIRVQARFIAKGAEDGGRDDSQLTELKLKSSYYNLLEQWQVYHTIDERSPLWSVRDNLPTALSALEVSIVVFDVAYNQDVRRFHAYSHGELVFGATFDVMVGRSMEHGEKVLEIRHDKLDSYALHNPSPAKPPPRSLRLLLKRGARVEADDAHQKAAAPSAAPAGVQPSKPRVQRVQVAPDGFPDGMAGEAAEVTAEAFSFLTPVVSVGDSEAGSSPRTGWMPLGADAREAPDARARTC